MAKNKQENDKKPKGKDGKGPPKPTSLSGVGGMTRPTPTYAGATGMGANPTGVSRSPRILPRLYNPANYYNPSMQNQPAYKESSPGQFYAEVSPNAQKYITGGTDAGGPVSAPPSTGPLDFLKGVSSSAYQGLNNAASGIFDFLNNTGEQAQSALQSPLPYQPQYTPMGIGSQIGNAIGNIPQVKSAVQSALPYTMAANPQQLGGTIGNAIGQIPQVRSAVQYLPNAVAGGANNTPLADFARAAGSAAGGARHAISPSNLGIDLPGAVAGGINNTPMGDFARASGGVAQSFPQLLAGAARGAENSPVGDFMRAAGGVAQGGIPQGLVSPGADSGAAMRNAIGAALQGLDDRGLLTPGADSAKAINPFSKATVNYNPEGLTKTAQAQGAPSAAASAGPLTQADTLARLQALGGGGAGQQLRGTAGSQYSQTGGQPGAGSGSFTQQDTLNRLKALDAGSSKYLNAGAQGGGQQSGSQIANQIANTQTKDLSREAAEWAGLQPMLGRLGYAFDNNTLNRLVNVYMDPGRGRNAGQNLKEAASFMIQDDIWAQAFQSETGYPPQQIHWDEHAMAMQGQGRDPLEGHPGAAQFMARKAAEIENQNQGAAIDIYRQLIPQGQGGLGTVY